MTIKRQRINAGALVEVEADNTDTVDVGGFLDAINTVGAKTAKFSGGSIMQANPGLRIGLTQVKINTGIAGRIRSIVVGSDTGTLGAANMINGLISVPGATRTVVGQYGIIDFSNVSTQNLTVNYQNQNTIQTHTFKVEIANLVGGPYTDLGNTFVPASQTNTTKDFGSQTWQFVRISIVSSSGNPDALNINEVNEFSTVTNTVTVRLRSSATLDSVDGIAITPDIVINESSNTILDTELLLTGNGEFVTLEIVSFSGLLPIVTLLDITSIREEP